MRETGILAIGSLASLFASFLGGVSLSRFRSAVPLDSFMGFALWGSFAGTGIVLVVYTITRSALVAYGGVALPLCAAACASGFFLSGALIAM